MLKLIPHFLEIYVLIIQIGLSNCGQYTVLIVMIYSLDSSSREFNEKAINCAKYNRRVL